MNDEDGEHEYDDRVWNQTYESKGLKRSDDMLITATQSGTFYNECLDEDDEVPLVSFLERMSTSLKCSDATGIPAHYR